MRNERTQKLIDAGRKEKVKEARETGKGGSKGKEWPKGGWSNSRHTWDTPWHRSNWYDQTYGLEVDPRTAVELVPHLCEVRTQVSKIPLHRNACREEHTPNLLRQGV